MRVSANAFKFSDIDSFNTELHAYQIIHRSATTVQVPAFHGQVSLPEEFTDYPPYEYADENGEDVSVPLPSTALAFKRLHGQSLSDVLTFHFPDTITLLYLDTLQGDLRAGLRSLHQLGVTHGDIHENNIMFRGIHTGCCFVDFRFGVILDSTFGIRLGNELC